MKTFYACLVLLLLPTTWGQNTYNNFQNSNTPLADTDWFPLWKTANARNEKMSPANVRAGLFPLTAGQLLGRATGSGGPVALTADSSNFDFTGNTFGFKDSIGVNTSIRIGSISDGVTFTWTAVDQMEIDAMTSGNGLVIDMDTEDLIEISSATNGPDLVRFNLPVEVPYRAYNATNWNGSSRAVTEDAFRDVIENLPTGGPGGGGWNITGAWTNASDYVTGDHVTNIKGSFVASADHVAEAATEPGIGGSWPTVWQQVSFRPVLSTGRIPFGDVDGQLATDALFFYTPGTQTFTAQNAEFDSANVDTFNVTNVTSAFTRAALAALSTTQGAILYRGSAQWDVLSPGTAGQVLQTQGAGANPQWASAGSGNVASDAIFNAKGDLVVGTADNTASRLAVGTNDQVLVADSTQATGVKWATPTSGASDFDNYDDKPWWVEGFLGASTPPTSTAAIGDFGLQRSASGGTMSFINGTIDEVGIASCDTTTGTTDSCWCVSSATGVYFGGGTHTLQFKVQIPALADGTNSFSAVYGFHDLTTAAAQDGAYFLHDQTTGNWQIACRSNSTGSPTTTSTAITAGTWYKLKIVVNAAASSVSFFVNGTEVSGSPLTANIPSAVNRQTGIRWGIVKSAGTSARSAYCGYMLYKVDYN